MVKKGRYRKRRPHAVEAEIRVPEDPASLPTWVVWGTYGLLTIFLFRAFVFSNEMLFGSDTEALGYMARAFYADAIKAGNFPLWNPLLLGGTPFLGSLSGGDSLYPPSAFLLLLMTPFRALGWKLILHVFLAGIGMYGWTRRLGVSRPAAFIAGIGYLVAPYMVTLVFTGHDGKLFVTALTPFLFWAVESFMTRGRARAWAALASVITLVTLTTHFQMAYFLFGAVGMFALFRSIEIYRRPVLSTQSSSASRGRLATSRFALFLVAAITGAGAAGVQLLPAVDYIREDSRRSATTTDATEDQNKQYAAQFSLHAEEALASLMLPAFVGNSQANAEWARGTYWGKNFFKLNHEYIGWALVILAGLSFFGAPRRHVRLFLTGLFAIAVLYTLGASSPVWNLLYHTLPGIKLVRSASMVIFLAGFAATTLAAFGVDRILAWSRGETVPERAKHYLWAVMGLSLIVLLLASSDVLFPLWNSLVYRDIDAQKLAALGALKPFIVQGAFLATVIAAVVVALSWAAETGRLSQLGITVALAILIAVDGGRIDAPFILTRDFEDFARAGPNIEELVQRQRTESPFRVFDYNRGGQEVRAAMFGLELATGHHPNDMARYRELIGMAGGGEPENLLLSDNIRRILNVRYLIWPVRQVGALPNARQISATQLSDGSLFEAVYQVEDLPRARLVAQALVQAPDAVVAALMDPNLDVETTVVVEESPPISLGGGIPVGSVQWIGRSANESSLSVQTDRNSLLILADNYFSAWHATVDGAETPVLRVNHALMAIPLQPGTHSVELSFKSRPMAIGLWLSIGFIVVLLTVVGASFVRPPRRSGGTLPSEGAAE